MTTEFPGDLKCAVGVGFEISLRSEGGDVDSQGEGGEDILWIVFYVSGRQLSVFMIP